MSKIADWIIHELGGLTRREALRLQDQAAGDRITLNLLRKQITDYNAEVATNGLGIRAEERHQMRGDVIHQLAKALEESGAVDIRWHYDQQTRRHVCRGTIRVVK